MPTETAGPVDTQSQMTSPVPTETSSGQTQVPSAPSAEDQILSFDEHISSISLLIFLYLL